MASQSSSNKENAYVQTITERCRVCYTCVRECPAKLSESTTVKLELISERCIACGNCVLVCSQHAKQVVSSIPQVESLLKSNHPVAACVAPSFPAEFDPIEPGQLVGMLRTLGFDYVNEVSFGADLVARGYRELLNNNKENRYIATTCPAIVGYVEKYHPELVNSLAPIVSPMSAIAKVLKQTHGDKLKIVFLGPCIAKKGKLME